MAGIQIKYDGELSTKAVHLENGAELRTDAPIEVQGLGRHFSPTDLFAASLGSCVLTLMGIVAKKLDIDLKGTKAMVSKEMQKTPVRRISKIKVEVVCPHTFDSEVTQALIKAAEHCPVHQSLHPDIVQEFTFHWGHA